PKLHSASMRLLLRPSGVPIALQQNNPGEDRMAFQVKEEVRDDLLSRGFSRRQMMRTAMMFAGGAAALSISGESAVAASDDGAPGMVRIGLNECWTGPMAPGLAAGT